jgi:hypothetical protein
MGGTSSYSYSASGRDVMMKKFIDGQTGVVVVLMGCGRLGVVQMFLNG